MSRLDRHINTVRGRMLLGTLLKSLAWSLLVFAAVVLLNILIDRFLTARLPHPAAFFWAGAGAAVAVALTYTFWKRPTARQAAVAIDERLGLKEKFSTALYVRPLNDPFAAAAVRDAEATADNVSLHKRFPVAFPRMMIGTIAVIVTALLVGRFLGPHPLFASDNAPVKRPQANADRMTPENKKLINQALKEIDDTPAMTPQDKVKIEEARRTMEDLRQRPAHDAVAEQRSALKAMQDMSAIKDKVRELREKSVQAKSEMDLIRAGSQPFDENGPLSDVQKDLASANFEKAAADLGRVVDNFDKLKPEDRNKAADQMKQLENQLNQIAHDPKAQQQIADKLSQMGATPQQLQQLANAAQQAANGDPQAQKQVQQLANQIAQAANQQQSGQTPQQQQQVSQQVQQMVKQMQGNANSQQAAQGMASAAGALARQMAAAAGQQGGGQQARAGGHPGGQQPGGQQPGGQQPGGAQAGGAQAGGAQAGGQPAGGQQPGGQQPGGQQPQAGGQPGGAGGPGGQQSMADAKAQMQQALRDVQDAADQGSQGNGPMADAGQPGGDPGQGEGGNPGGNQPGNGGQGDWNKGNANNHGAGSGGPGVSDGGPRPKGAETPVAFEKQLAPSDADEKGRFNSVRTVKAMSERGTSRVGMSDVVANAEKDSADEVDQDRITRSEQAVVKRYFDDLKRSQEQPPADNAPKP